MFNLRKEQMKIFEQVAAKDFEQRVTLEVRKHSADRCASMDDAALSEFTCYGIERAKTYGIVSESDVCKYLSVMLALGKDFDRDPRYPWATKTLADPTLAAPGARVSRLAAEALGAGGGE